MICNGCGGKDRSVFLLATSLTRSIGASTQRAIEFFGIASFVAHDDIEPVREWENEIVRALFSMHVLVALLSPNFNGSKWTDQEEVGVAMGRKIPIVPVNIGTNPYGFVAKYQAISVGTNATRIANRIIAYMLGDENMRSSAVDAYIHAVGSAPNFDQANKLSGWLDQITRLSEEQELALVAAYNENDQAYSAFRMRDRIVAFLNRATGHAYETYHFLVRRIDA